MRLDKIVKKTLKYANEITILNILPEKNWERPKCDIGFVGCKSLKMCVLAKLPDMSSNLANIEKIE